MFANRCVGRGGDALIARGCVEIRSAVGIYTQTNRERQNRDKKQEEWRKIEKHKEKQGHSRDR